MVMRRAGRLLVALLMMAVLGGALLAAAGAWWVLRPLPLARNAVELSIEPGTSPREIARGWAAAGVEVSPFLLYEWFRWSGQATRIRAGSYQATPGMSAHGLLRMMVQGDERLAVVRLIEGWTFKRVREELARSPDLRPDTSAMSDAQIMAALGQPGTPAEGRFFPDTYSFSKGSSDLEVLRRAHRAMQQRLADAWVQRAPGLPLRSPDEALTLASIVEKETGHEEDRGLVAGVFINRLRIGMPLQTDPTVIYGLGDAFDGNLRRRDLLTDTPFNTYTRAGLPPTPIAMPGKAALLATVRPAPTKALYFVARGDGRSAFSESLAEHNRAVDRYQRGRTSP